MNKILVWDIPTRLFHWAFAASLTGAIAIGFLTDDDAPLFMTHMLLGIVAVFLLIMRLVMGLVGSRYARFASYPLRPGEAATYFASAVFSKTKRYAGNNPGSALAAVLMFLLVPALFITGAGIGGGEVGEIHETLAWALLAVVALHIAGLVLHTIRHRESIGLSMITGKKTGEPADAIPSSQPVWGVAFALAATAWIGGLFANHDAANVSVRLPLIGASIQLGENESEENEHGQSGRREHEDDDDD
jgi:cytochrome b